MSRPQPLPHFRSTNPPALTVMGLLFSECSGKYKPSGRKRRHVLFRLRRSSSLKWIKMLQFSLPLPYLHSFIGWTNTDQVKSPPPDYIHIAWAKRVRWRPTARTSTQTQPSLCGLGWIHVTMSQWPPYPFPPSAKTMSLITLRIFFFLLTSMWTLDCVDRCRKSQCERVWGLKWDGVPSLVKPLITWLSKHNQGRRFVDHPPLTHACID